MTIKHNIARNSIIFSAARIVLHEKAYTRPVSMSHTAGRAVRRFLLCKNGGTYASTKTAPPRRNASSAAPF